MPNVTVRVPPALGLVINRAIRRTKKTKHKTLRHLMKLALNDLNDFWSPDQYGPEEEDRESCTLDISEDEYDGALAYRDKYDLVSRVEFLRYVLVHGAYLWELEKDTTATT